MQITDGGGGDQVHFVLDRKADQPHLWLMPGTPIDRPRVDLTDN
jgi:hypothetical protein